VQRFSTKHRKYGVQLRALIQTEAAETLAIAPAIVRTVFMRDGEESYPGLKVQSSLKRTVQWIA